MRGRHDSIFCSNIIIAINIIVIIIIIIIGKNNSNNIIIVIINHHVNYLHVILVTAKLDRGPVTKKNTGLFGRFSKWPLGKNS